MKIGDVVMFTNYTGRYGKWFYGQIGVVENYVNVFKSADGKAHVRVRWIQPVPYFDSFATVSNFGANNFEVFNESR